MPTTRNQGAHADQGDDKKRKTPPHKPKPTTTKKPKKTKDDESTQVDDKGAQYTIERGYIYFFFRPRVQLEEAHSLDDVRNFHMLLIPRPPRFAVGEPEGDVKPESQDDKEMKLLEPGADAVPAQPQDASKKQKYRLLTIGKKRLPDPTQGGEGQGRKAIFWAVVTRTGTDLHALEEGLGEKSYETKTRGTRHEGAVRLAGRGAYAIVTNNPRVPSGKATYFGYHISHPAEPGELQQDLGIDTAASYVLQVKNPLAPATGPGQVANAKGAEYPDRIMESTFGRGTKGRETYGLRFAPCDDAELLDYENTQLLLIGARGGEEGLEESLGEGRGEALKDVEDQESKESIDQVFRELGLDKEVFSMEPIKGEWI